MPPRPYARPAAESSSAASERRGGSRPAGEIKSGKLDPLPVRLKRLGLVSDWDFVLHLPLRYEDETRIDPIGLLRAGETAQIQGEVVRSSTISTARGPQLVAELADQTGRVTLRFIHYYPTTRSLLTIGTTLRAFGEPRPAYSGGLELIHPKLKKPVAGEDALPSSLTPVYSLGEGIQQTWLRKRINRALLDLMGMDDPLPAEVAAALQLPGLKASLEYLHHPPADAPHEPLMNRTDPHWQRLKFDELLAQQGDAVMNQLVCFVANQWKKHYDRPDERVVCRLTDTLFAIGCADKTCAELAEELRGIYAEMPRECVASVGLMRRVAFTQSIGCACTGEVRGKNWDALYKLCEERLAAAKTAGGDQVCAG